MAITEVVDAGAMAVAAVWARTDRAVWTREPHVAEACAVEAGAVARAVVWANAERAVIASVTSGAGTLEMGEAFSVVRTVVGAGPDRTVRPGVPSITVARAIVALAMSRTVRKTRLQRAIKALPPLLAHTVVVHTAPVAVAGVRAGTDGAVGTSKAHLAVARAVVAVTMVGAVVLTTQESTVMACESLFADTPEVLADAVARALVWTGSC